MVVVVVVAELDGPGIGNGEETGICGIIGSFASGA